MPPSSIDFIRFKRNFLLLCWRAFTEQSREIHTIFVKLFVTCFFALLIGGIYSNIGTNQISIQNRIGLLFIICINQGFNACLGVLNVFPKEIVIVSRERSANAYDSLSYFWAKYIVELPLNVLPAFIYGIIVYWMVGLNSRMFGYFILILMLEALTACSLGLTISAIAPNLEAALGMGPPIVIIALIFGGFYINISSLPIVANWIPYFSFLRWAFEALCINEFKGEHFDCSATTLRACESSGSQVLDRLAFGGKNTEDGVLGLSMLLIGFTLSAIFFLERRKITYIPLGFVGKNRQKDVAVVAEAAVGNNGNSNSNKGANYTALQPVESPQDETKGATGQAP